jgi:TonB family protein
MGFEGSPVVAFIVEADGSIQTTAVLQSSGHRLLDDAVRNIWLQYRFDRPDPWTVNPPASWQFSPSFSS